MKKLFIILPFVMIGLQAKEYTNLNRLSEQNLIRKSCELAELGFNKNIKSHCDYIEDMFDEVRKNPALVTALDFSIRSKDGRRYADDIAIKYPEDYKKLESEIKNTSIINGLRTHYHQYHFTRSSASIIGSNQLYKQSSTLIKETGFDVSTLAYKIAIEEMQKCESSSK
jgi:hypothetical protein